MHTLKWRYVKDGSKVSGSDCGWVDYVQWSGTYPDATWDTISYTYDAFGRRVAKAVDGQTTTRYVYDGAQCLAEYSAGANLLRKYIYGPRVDEPVSMIESAGSYAGTYYYHFDGLGSVAALTNSAGSPAELYEYSVYGQVAASDANHPNRFLFTGREFDKDTGLYYYRARYYHPEIGRFLQTDPVGYDAGMNLYRYCTNNPARFRDPFGYDPCDPCDPCDCVYLDPCDISNIISLLQGSSKTPEASGSDAAGSSLGSPNAGSPVPRLASCPSTKAEAKSSKSLCEDSATGGTLHKGQDCYRQVVPRGSKDEFGLHCCYDRQSGKLVNQHVDPYSPAIGGGGGRCEYDFVHGSGWPGAGGSMTSPGWRMCKHIFWDVIAPRIPGWF